MTNDLPRANRPAHQPRMHAPTVEDYGYQDWAIGLTESWLPEITAGLVQRGPERTTIDTAELARRQVVVSALLAAARKAEHDLEEIEALLAYVDVKPR